MLHVEFKSKPGKARWLHLTVLFEFETKATALLTAYTKASIVIGNLYNMLRF